MNAIVRLGLTSIFAALILRAHTPVELLAEIDPVTGLAKNPTNHHTLDGLVSARARLPDGRVVAYIQDVGTAGILTVTTAAEAGQLLPRNQISLRGKIGRGPFGSPALMLVPGSIKLINTNRSLGASEIRGSSFFKDPTSLAGRYVQLTNVTFTTQRIDAQGHVTARSADGEVTLLATLAIIDQDLPPTPVNVFGVPVLENGKWVLLSSRLLSANARTAQALATKHTCVTCHNPDLKLIGPSFRDVAPRYRRDTEAVSKLAAQIDKGGTGKWGAVPMPPLGAKVPLEDRRMLSEWVMSYRWDALLAE